MTRLAYVPTLEYCRRILELHDGAGWQIPNEPRTRLHQDRQFGSIAAKEMFQASFPGLDVSWVRVLSAWYSKGLKIAYCWSMMTHAAFAAITA